MKRFRILTMSASLLLLFVGWLSPVLAQTREVFNNYNSFVECSPTDKATFTLKEALKDARASIWYDFGNGSMDVRYTLALSGSKIGGGVVQKGDCARDYTWCNGLMNLGDLEPGTYTVSVAPGRICHNSNNDGGNGFIKIVGIPKASEIDNGASPTGKQYWRLTGVTVPKTYDVANPWSGSVPCHSCVTYSWTILKDPPNTLSTKRSMCADCWGLKTGKSWGGHATWSLLPKILVPETKIRVHVEVSGGEFTWMGVTPTITADAGQPTAIRDIEFRVPVHGAYADTSKPTITYPLRFVTSCTSANGTIQRGDPDLTIYYTYEWVGK